MTQEWWRGAVIYQIYPRSFFDASGDGIGDLPGITQHLEYIAELGVDGIWLSPFFRSPMKDYGYDVSDYREVDPMFGTMDDFDRMVERAHELGLKVIIDQVLSHTSDHHPWFRESRMNTDNPRADWYVWADAQPDGSPPNNWLSVFGGVAWEWDPHRNQYYLHNFLKEQPDLNCHNADVQDALLDDMAFWLDRGVDGFRLDTANFYMHDPLLRNNPPREPDDGDAAHDLDTPYAMQLHVYDKTRPENIAFIKRIRALLDRYDGERMIVAEIGDDNTVRVAADYTMGSDRLHTAYSFALLGQPKGPAVIRSMVESEQEAGESWPSWSFSNHDVERVASRWADGLPSDAHAKVHLAALCSLRGTIFVYQGEELGLPEADVPYEQLHDPVGKTFWPRKKGRDGCRTPMPWHEQAIHGGFSEAHPWLPVVPSHLDRAVNVQHRNSESVLAFSRKFLAWRKTEAAMITGDITFIEAPQEILAFERRMGDERLLMVFNLTDAPASLRLDDPSGLQSIDAAGLGGSIENGVLRLDAFEGFAGRRAA